VFIYASADRSNAESGGVPARAFAFAAGYPPITGDKVLEKAVSPYAGLKRTLQFPLDEPIPYELIKRVVKLRVKQDSTKGEQKSR